MFDSESKFFSLEYIFKRISDENALTLFKRIALSEANKSALLKAGLTKKQYYVRISRLMDAGLIKRYYGKYSLTSFGCVVYGSLMTISNALDHHPKLLTMNERKISQYKFFGVGHHIFRQSIDNWCVHLLMFTAIIIVCEFHSTAFC